MDGMGMVEKHEKQDSVEKMYRSLLVSFPFKFQHMFELIDGHKQCNKHQILTWDIVGIVGCKYVTWTEV